MFIPCKWNYWRVEYLAICSNSGILNWRISVLLCVCVCVCVCVCTCVRVYVHLLYTMKVSRQKIFAVFAVFTWSAKLLYESSRWHCSDLRESIWDSAKFFREGLRVQLAAKLFCLKTFMVYACMCAHVCVLVFAACMSLCVRNACMHRCAQLSIYLINP